MKVQFSHSSGGGPGVFMKRLRKYLVEKYDIREVKNNPDIYFSAVWMGSPPKGARHIHRVDNCYFDTLQKKRTGNNAAIKKAIKKAYAVIYQSKFSLRICRGVLGVKAKRYKIIHNAIDQSVCDKVVPFKHEYNKLFVACALWRPIKRPNSIMSSFLKARLENSALIMIGRGVSSKHKNILCVGQIRPDQTYSYYKASDAMIHIARLDACPNTIIESLSFGKPVICNNAGGAPEIVGNDGIIAKIDPPDNYKEFPMKHPDKINTNLLAESIKECSNREWNIKRSEFDMSYCAKQYYDFFLKVLND